MAYTWCGMRKVGWDEIQELHKNGSLAGLYKLYDDNTEAQIQNGYDWKELVQFYEAGGEFGEEK